MAGAAQHAAGLVLLAALLAQTAAPAASAASPAAAGGETAWPSASGRLRLGYRSEIEPVVINRIHSWVLHLRTAAGEPVSGASISVSGGMPAHDHGLPTRPRVTERPEDGDYLLEGLRFHMNGAWELRFDIEAAGTRDHVLVPVEL